MGLEFFYTYLCLAYDVPLPPNTTQSICTENIWRVVAMIPSFISPSAPHLHRASEPNACPVRLPPPSYLRLVAMIPTAAPAKAATRMTTTTAATQPLLPPEEGLPPETEAPNTVPPDEEGEGEGGGGEGGGSKLS